MRSGLRDWLRAIWGPGCALTTQQRAVLTCLVLDAKGSGPASPAGLTSLGASCAVSRATLCRALADLEARGLVASEQRPQGQGWGPTCYTVPPLTSSLTERLAADGSGVVKRRPNPPAGSLTQRPPGSLTVRPQVVSLDPHPPPAPPPHTPSPLTLSLPPSSPLSPRKQRKKAATPSEPDPGHQAVVDAYFAAYEQARGSKPPFTSRDAKECKKLREQVGTERAVAIIRAAFADPFWADKASIKTIAADPAKFTGGSKRGRPGRAPAQPDHGKTGWE